MSRPLLLDMTFPGEPATKQRPRAGRGGTFYTPKATKEAEDALREQMRLFCASPTPTSGLAVRLEFHCATQRRKDLDNLVKLVWDAANGVIWEDDSQVYELYVKLTRGCPQPHTSFQLFAPEQQEAPLLAA